MKNIPKSIKIFGHTYKIYIRKDLILNEIPCAGYVHLIERKIYLNKALPLEARWEVLIHEVFHGLISELEINIDDGTEEILVNHSSKLAWQIMQKSK